jgi:hypothetical protein
MNFITSVAGYFFLSAGVGFILPFVVAILFQRESWKTVAPLLFALALVGACAGFAGGMSRAAAVGDVIPAFLGLLGAVGVYLFGVDQSRGIIASFGAASLSIALLIGYAAGSAYRAEPEDHREIREYCARAYTNADLLDSEVAFERFRERMGRLCDASMYWRVKTSKQE